MRAGKRNSRLCYFLTVILLLSGMCFEHVEADSSFVYPECSKTAAVLSSGGSVLTAVDSCTPEMLGHPDADTAISDARRPSGRTSFRSFQTILFLRNCFQGLIIILLTVGIGISIESASHTVIVSYIHKKDGKKSESPNKK